MTEEVKDPVDPVVTDEEVKEYIPSETEQVAMGQGWKPKEDWVKDGRDPDEWRSARDFIDRGELLTTIKSLNKKVSMQDQALKAFAQHHETVFEQAHKKALDELKAQKRLAIREGEHELAEQIDDEITKEKETFEKQAKELEKVKAQESVGMDPEVAAWTEKNKWYTTDTEMQTDANGFAIAYVQRMKGQGKEPTKAEVFAHVEAKIRKAYPEKFEGRREAPSPTGGNGSGRQRKEAADDFEMTDIEKKVMRDLIRSGHMTKEKYIAELKKVR